MKRMKFYFRVLVLLSLLSLFLLGAVARLYNLQITHGNENQKVAEKRLRREVTLPAARGEIFDRYSRPLVVNRLSYVLCFDNDRLIKEDPADTLYRLIALMDKNETPYACEFPVMGPPFQYRTDMSDKEKEHLREFLKKKDLDPELSADALMSLLRKEYLIDERFSASDAVRIAGIRYELELRVLYDSVKPYKYIPPYQFAEDVDISLVSMIREQSFPGVRVDAVPIREYRTDFAAHLLGRVGPIPEENSDDYKANGYAANEAVGLDGIEYALESWLRGKAGSRTEETTLSGKVTSIIRSNPPEPGKNCLLTIDICFQEQMEYALASGIEELRARGLQEGLTPEDLAGGGAAVAIDVRTGDVLAMASYPTFDLSDFTDNYAALLSDPARPMLNRALAGAYEPGSTFKMAVAIAALESGVVGPSTKILDRGRYMRFSPSYTPTCSGHHGSISVSKALGVSCNYFFYESGWLTGIESIQRYARALGLGAKTGIELPGEREGILAGPDYCAEHDIHWNGGDVLQASIGQSYNQFTPLQLANYAAALATDGVRYKPHILLTVKSYSYEETLYDTPRTILSELDLKQETLDAIHTGMRMVTQSGGTAGGVFSNYEVAVAAKTGSAQKAADGKPANGVFVAYAPYNDPEIAVCVVVERGGGGARVAPIARSVFEAYFNGKLSMEESYSVNEIHP